MGNALAIRFHVIGISVFPMKADPPLIVDPDTMLPFAIALQGFEPVARWNPEVLQMPGLMKVQELASCNPFDRTKPRHILIIEQRPYFGIAKGPDHHQ